MDDLIRCDLEKCCNEWLKGSSVIDSAISQVFGANPIDMKIKEIDYLLDRTQNMNFNCIFEPRSMTYNFCVEFGELGEERYHGAIPDAVMRNEPAQIIVNKIIDLVWDAKIRASNEIDPEWICENENEQAFYDAAYDYELIV